MSNKQDHLRLKEERGKFHIDCNQAIFSNDEIEVLEKYGHWFMALTTGELSPITKLQEEFILVATNKKDPFTIEETAWFKYFGRKRVEAKYGDKLSYQYHPEEDSFYNRTLVKSLKSTMFRVMNDNHREK